MSKNKNHGDYDKNDQQNFNGYFMQDLLCSSIKNWLVRQLKM